MKARATVAPDDRSYREIINAWCLYDWANSAFATTVLAAVFPPFFRSLAIAAGQSEGAATASWAFTTAIALLVVAVIAPVLGAIADVTGRVARYLAVSACVGILATAAFVWIPRDGWTLASILFIAADLGFAASIVFYESLLPHVARPDDIDRVSARGYAWGYAGGGLLLALQAALISKPAVFGLPDAATAVRLVFALTALWWALFSIPMFKYGLPQLIARSSDFDSLARRATTGRLSDLGAGLRRLRTTLREIRRYRELFAFLFAFWIYSDAIGTIVKMATAYGDEIGVSLNHLIGALLLTQLVGVPFTLVFGRLAGGWNARGALLVALAVYVLICVGGFFMRTATHFYILAVAVGVVQGGAQALSRSLFGSMVPRGKSAEFFGFFSMSSRFAGIVGPLVFGLVGQFTGTSRLGILALVAFFGVGSVLLLRVDVDRGRQMAGEENARV